MPSSRSCGSPAHAARPDQHVAGVRDRAVGEHPLDVVLGQRHQVAERHRRGRQHDHHRHPPVGQRPETLDEQAQDQREGTDLRHDREIAGDRRRRALVRVRRPVVERHRRDLERHAGGQERQAHRQARRQRRGAGDDRGQGLVDRVELRRAGQAPDEGDAEQEDRRAERAEQEVLDRAFGGIGVGLVEGGQQVAGQDHQLEPEEQHQQVARRRDQHRAGHREDEDRGELGDRQAARDQVVGAEGDGQRDGGHEQQIEEGGQVIDLVRAPERRDRRGPRPHDHRQDGRDREAGERDAHRHGRPAGPDEVDDEDRGRCQDARHQRADRDEVLPAQWATPVSGSSEPRLCRIST